MLLARPPPPPPTRPGPWDEWQRSEWLDWPTDPPRAIPPRRPLKLPSPPFWQWKKRSARLRRNGLRDNSPRSGAQSPCWRAISHPDLEKAERRREKANGSGYQPSNQTTRVAA